MKLPRVDKGYRNFRRYQQIIRVLIKYGFADIFDRLEMRSRFRIVGRLRRKEPRLDHSHTAGQRLRMALEELGPTFIKVGQILSTRSFLLPPSIIDELSKLQDEVKPVLFEQVKVLVEKELDGSLDALFDSFDEIPIASASIAQAHRATLLSGEQVVVKVQRPGIARLIATDMDILHNLATLVERYIEESHRYDPVNLVEELSRSMKREIDFSNEARSIEQFGANFRNKRNVKVPQVYWEYCTSKIVTLEYIDGIKVSDFEKLRAAGVDFKRIAHIGTQFILKQIFEDGFFHADPHPGNLFLTRDEKIAPIDFGIMGRLDDWLSDEFSDLMIGIWRRDIELIIRVFVNLGAIDIEADPTSLRFELSEFLNRYYGLPLKKLDMKQIMREGMEIFSRHQMRLPSNLLLLGKTLGTYEDLGRKLDPDYNFLKEVRPYIKKLFYRRLNPEKIGYESSKSLRDFYDLLKMMPHELELILRRMRRGRMAIELQHRGLDKLRNDMDRSFNRLSFSLIIASLILASSLVMIFNKGPMLFGFPVLGVLGFVFAGIMGVGLIIAILRSGKV